MMKWRDSSQGSMGDFETITVEEEQKHNVPEIWFVARYRDESVYFVSPGWVSADNRRHDLGPFETKEEARALVEMFMVTGYTGKEK